MTQKTGTWSPRAATELRAIAAYLEEKNPPAAEKLVLRLLAAAESVARVPRLGRIVPERGRDDLRESIEGNYRVVYRIVRNGVEVVTVFHGAREFPDEVK